MRSQVRLTHQSRFSILCLGLFTAAISAACRPAHAADVDPAEVENAAAKTEAEMKPYTDVIANTEVTFDMVPIPGGKFVMGSPAARPAARTTKARSTRSKSSRSGWASAK